MNHWSANEVKFLIDNYATKDIEFCCNNLNRNESQIRNKVFKLGIKREKDISGERNPNWKGGKVEKSCSVCGKDYSVTAFNSNSNFCSLQCYGVSQKGIKREKKQEKFTKNKCLVCGNEYEIRTCHSHRSKTCSDECSRKYRSTISSGENNASWKGGLSKMPYPYNWPEISKVIRDRDGNVCMNPNCKYPNSIIAVHHIDYDKTNCDPKNLITICSRCNLDANIGRSDWYSFYMNIQSNRGICLDVVMPRLIKDPDRRKGENHQMAKLTNQDVYEIRSFLSIFKARGIKTRIAEMFGVTSSSIYNIIKGKSWI